MRAMTNQSNPVLPRHNSAPAREPGAATVLGARKPTLHEEPKHPLLEFTRWFLGWPAGDPPWPDQHATLAQTLSQQW
jgi:hypothetical protein